MQLTDFTVLSFDCYGTMIDWESGIWTAFQPLLDANGSGDIDRAAVLREFAAVESAVEAEHPTLLYPSILMEVHREVARLLELATSPALDAAFGASVPDWPAFDDSTEALTRLGRRYQLVILSNVHRAGFAASQRRLAVEFDAVYTAEDIGSYKPAPANFDFLLSRIQTDLSRGRGDLLHTAQSLFHDHAPAAEAGLATAWIDRQRLSEGGDWGATAHVANPPDTDFVFFSLAEMADAVDEAFA